ncbi:hypothetical protein L4D00_20740 [Photobacterium swingsii]|uniref:Uncharacterized protein n=1 Tax=Photobacterium swingsii TaxID=680026 RepID=A0A0J8VFP6_9GAMM|nr:hypothetical protein [Photobacterium swingsii]KMV31947.1 membrane protein [Photobacterium swingsii]PSW25601.1 hypothetical protein C9I94_08145 [Photobacterium swingsii]
MLQTSLSVIEMLLITLGVLMIAKSMLQFGQRTHNWLGVATMFFKRVGMNVAEYRWYRMGVASFVLGVVVRIVNLTVWPAY